MALIDWSDKLTLGVEAMDATHREFVAQLADLHEAPQEAFGAQLDAFIAHTVEHFEQERRWMDGIAFPPKHCHLQEHEGVLGIMREVRRMVSEDKPQVGRVLTRELAPWFENHAASMDATLAFFLRCVDAGIDPMQALAEQNRSVCTTGGEACGHAANACAAPAQTQDDATTVAR